jgi:hypothetical protein
MVMGKKRSYQWQAVPDEGMATDYKTFPNGPHDADSDDRRFSRVMEGKFSRAQPIPPKLLDPKARRAARIQNRRGRHGRKG